MKLYNFNNVISNGILDTFNIYYTVYITVFPFNRESTQKSYMIKSITFQTSAITVLDDNGTTQVYSDQNSIQSFTLPLDIPIILKGTPSTGQVSAGTVTVQVGNITVVGAGTTFTRDFVAGNQIVVNGEARIVSSIESDTSLTTNAWSQNASNVVYSIIK